MMYALHPSLTNPDRVRFFLVAFLLVSCPWLAGAAPAGNVNANTEGPGHGPEGAAPVRVLSFAKEADGIRLAMDPGVLKLQVCGDRIVRVTYSPTPELPKVQSVAVVQPWKPVPFDVRETPDTITIVTDKLQVAVDRKNGTLRFLDAAGRPVLEELSEGGKRLTPAVVNQKQAYRVEQSFQSPADEWLYGMGQYQEGTWNWRGIPLELRQHNTQISIPMLVSSKGYGLLWDNASLTDFNPVDDEIAMSSGTDTSESQGPQATEDLATAKPEKKPGKPSDRTGTYKTTVAGDYVFAVRNGDRKGRIGLSVGGKELAEIRNTWVPYGVSAKIALPANTTVAIKLLGGGPGARVFGRPFSPTTTFRSQVGDAIDYYFFYGPKLDDVIAGYRTATGAAPMWPKWAYGFWQCRERYNTQDEILSAVAEFRRRQIPIDLIVQDWQYWGHWGWGSYHWDEKRYPDPAAMIAKLHEQNVRFMISVWSNPQADTHEQLVAARAMVPVDSALAGKPGPNGKVPTAVWYDALNPAARQIRWKAMKKAFFDIGTDAWWQDAAEPGDDGNALNNCNVFLGSANRYRNAYPLFTNQCVYEGQRAASDQKRVCILTRSAYAGQQRYAAGCWSGDVRGDWMTFRRQIPAGLNFSLTGIPYWTTDTGGFFRPGKQYTNPDFNELLVRWFQWSTFCPILRAHGYKTETEIWKWPLAEKYLLKYDRLRYLLLPYNYSVAWKITSDGYTPMRALAMDFAADKKVCAIDDQYMFGPAFLVCPVTEPGAKSRKVYLPAGSSWTNFWTGDSNDGGQEITAAAEIDTLPLFVRAGSIVPIGPELQYTSEKPADPIELRVYPGADGTFVLYEDEGDNYNYEKGAFTKIQMRWDDGSATLNIGARADAFPGMLATRTFRAVIVGKGHGIGDGQTETVDKVVKFNGEALSVSFK